MTTFFSTPRQLNRKFNIDNLENFQRIYQHETKSTMVIMQVFLDGVFIAPSDTSTRRIWVSLVDLKKEYAPFAWIEKNTKRGQRREVATIYRWA